VVSRWRWLPMDIFVVFLVVTSVDLDSSCNSISGKVEDVLLAGILSFAVMTFIYS
jgi:hypothetical protein